MPQHRSLTLKKFVSAVDPELLERYFTEKLPIAAKLPHRIIMDYPAIEDFLGDERNEEPKALVLEDFRKINDICEKAKNHVVRAYGHFDIPWDDEDSPENLAMRLFLGYPDAFDYAYTWYCYYHTSSMMSFHRIPGDFKLTKGKLDDFLNETKKWFKKLAKGRECIITRHDEEDSTVILIKHGSYIRTVAYWEENEIKMYSFRPANEDVLLYDKTKGVLRIKASLPKDRKQYIESFSRCIMGDESLADSEDRDTIYTLKPLQDGTFNWEGNENIKGIILTELKLDLPGSTESVIKISSKDVRKTLAEDISDIGLNSGELTYAHFHFILDVEGKKRKVSFTISPPTRSDLVQKKYSDIISKYLKEQGVELI